MIGKLALAAASLLLTLGVLELCLRAAGYEAIYEVYSKPSLFWRYDPLLGWSHDPGATGVYVGPRPWPVEYRTPVHINSDGLRGPEITEKPAGSFRILVLGDSVVAAFEVAYADTFVALLEQRLNDHFDFPIQVINGGVRGYGTDQSYLYYRERGRLLEPDLVLFIHSTNDPRNNMTLHRMRRPFGKPAFSLAADGSLHIQGQPVPDYPLCSSHTLDTSYRPIRTDGLTMRFFCRLQTQLADRSALFTFASLRIRRSPELLRFLYSLGSPEPMAALPGGVGFASVLPLLVPGLPEENSDAAYALSSALLLALAREVRADDAGFLLTIRRTELDRMERWRFEAEDVDVIHPSILSFEDLRASMHFVNDGHYNAQGHYYAARVLAPLVEEKIRQLLADEPG